MSAIYDNTITSDFGSEEGLILMENRCWHDINNDHRIEFFDQIIQGEVDGKLKKCYFHMSQTESCGKKDCHHPQYSPMPLRPYKIEYEPLP